MQTKRTNFPIKMKIGIHLEEANNAQISSLFCNQSVLRSEKPICLKMQICIERIGENAILMHFDAIVPEYQIRSSGELENIPNTNYR